MDAINSRLKELENLQVTLYLAKQATLKSRAQEDAEQQIKRQALDKTHIAQLDELEQEEDVSSLLPLDWHCGTEGSLPEIASRAKSTSPFDVLNYPDPHRESSRRNTPKHERRTHNKKQDEGQTF